MFSIEYSMRYQKLIAQFPKTHIPSKFLLSNGIFSNENRSLRDFSRSREARRPNVVCTAAWIAANCPTNKNTTAWRNSGSRNTVCVIYNHFGLSLQNCGALTLVGRQCFACFAEASPNRCTPCRLLCVATLARLCGAPYSAKEGVCTSLSVAHDMLFARQNPFACVYRNKIAQKNCVSRYAKN